jgi:signal transduction histidine kinase
MKKIFTALTLSAAIIGSASAQSAWTSHGEINKAPAQEAATRAAAGEIYIGHCSINDQIWPYDGLSLSYDARVGVGAILTEGMLKQYVGATIVGMYVGWDDEYSTANYECFVRADKFNGETLTTGSDEVQFGWNYVSLEEVTLTEDMKTLAVGFYTDLLKDVCSIPKLYPYGKENSNFLWSGETNANGEVLYDSKELGSMPIVLVLEDKDGLFHNLISISSCNADCIVEKGELHTAMARINNIGTNDIMNIEVTTTLGEESHTELIDFNQPIPAQQGGKVLLPVKCIGSGVHTFQITAVNGIAKSSNAVNVEMIGVSADVAEKYSYRPLLEYFVSEDNYMTVTYVDNYFWPGFEPYQEDITHIKIWDIYSIVDDQNMWKRITQMVKEGNMEQGFIMLKPLPFFPEVLAIEANAFWVTDDSGIETIWFFGRDITDNIEAAKKLKAAKEKAENSERLKSAFLANMSHEIRTPLNAIVGFSRLVAEVESPEDKAEFCRIIEENNERLLHLINELLDLSKIEANMIQLKSESINMHTLCTEVYNRFNLQSSSEIQLINETKNINLYAFADKNRTIQVISNLIDNALKFTERGNIRFGCYPKGDQIEIYVSDTGIGIPKDKIASIFDRFVKANENMYGTGLGLSISKMLVEKMNGKISVQSVLGKGTTFKFTLPKG